MSGYSSVFENDAVFEQRGASLGSKFVFIELIGDIEPDQRIVNPN